MIFFICKSIDRLKLIFFIALTTLLICPTKSIPDSRPDKIVSISPSLTEILFAIGAGPRIVAVDSFSNYPREAPITDLSAYEPNMEAIASYNPDLVVLSYDVGNLVEGLNTIGVRTVLLPAARDFPEILLQIKRLGAETGYIYQANILVESMVADMENLVNLMEVMRPLKIYHEIDENFYSASSNSFIGSIYKMLNFINIADQADQEGYGYPKLSPEYILSSNPDLIILPGKDANYIQKIKNRPGWSAISAVRNDAFLLIDPDIGSRWGPRIIDFATAIVTNRVDIR